MPALAAAQATADAHSALLATAIPATGAAFLVDSDGCSLGDGRSKDYAVTDFDASPTSVASNQFRVGSVRSNYKVVADRSSTNPDGTGRREIDVTYDITYKDGSKAEGGDMNTLISGSSSGSTMADGSVCTTPENKADFRFFGNRKKVSTFVTATNDRFQRTVLATGLANATPVVYSKYISLGVQDPAKVATYATITGPGLVSASVGTLKLLAPRLLRTDATLAGKRGNYVDSLDTDSFQICRSATGATVTADLADCAVGGAQSSSWGSFNFADATALDTSFALLGIKAGDVYTVNVYNDDGWKTINGQAGKMPIATYTSTLKNLPLSAAALAGTGTSTDLFARLVTSTKTPAELTTAIRAKTALPLAMSWTLPGTMPDGRALALNYVGTYEEGQANATGAQWPASKKFIGNYPGATATSLSFNFPAPVVALVVPTYAEVIFSYTNQNGNRVRSVSTMQ